MSKSSTLFISVAKGIIANLFTLALQLITELNKVIYYLIHYTGNRSLTIYINHCI